RDPYPEALAGGDSPEARPPALVILDHQAEREVERAPHDEDGPDVEARQRWMVTVHVTEPAERVRDAALEARERAHRGVTPPAKGRMPLRSSSSNRSWRPRKTSRDG